MRNRFLSTLSRVTSCCVEDLYDEISRKYSESHRSYHNLTHISECLAALQTLRLSEEDRVVMELAIWFHDVIYDPKSKTNEADSANFFLAKAEELGMDENLCSRVVSYIEATQRHEPPVVPDPILDYFLDIDLAILGADSVRFSEYDAAIRAEYDWVPESVYQVERRKVLQGFLERDAIYVTPEFYDRYEAKARQNLISVARD